MILKFVVVYRHAVGFIHLNWFFKFQAQSISLCFSIKVLKCFEDKTVIFKHCANKNWISLLFLNDFRLFYLNEFLIWTQLSRYLSIILFAYFFWWFSFKVHSFHSRNKEQMQRSRHCGKPVAKIRSLTASTYMVRVKLQCLTFSPERRHFDMVMPVSVIKLHPCYVIGSKTVPK